MTSPDEGVDPGATLDAEPGRPDNAPAPVRFLTLHDVAAELAISHNQIYALVRQGQLRAIKIGGRGQWRVGRDDLEHYIERLYAETRDFITEHPHTEPTTHDRDQPTGHTPGPTARTGRTPPP